MDHNNWIPITIAAWCTFELFFVWLTRSPSNSDRDSGSLKLLILVLGTSALVSQTAEFPAAANINIPPQYVLPTAWGVMLGGFLLRWYAMAALGRWFTPRVSFQPDQRLVCEGLYRNVRHPSYTGTTIIMCGMGLTTLNLIGLICVVVPSVAVLLQRITLEERVLVEEFGDAYRDYQQRTQKLLPMLF